ncbi:MAG: sigma-70 family RNA polymerase sigma factor [bacterium]
MEAEQPGEASSDGFAIHLRKIQKGSAESLKQFISLYKRRVTEIIKHDTLYKGFEDKLPYPEEIAEQSLKIYASKNNEGISGLRISPFMVKEFRNFIKRHIKHSVHQKLKLVCQEVYQQIPGSEERLLHYEINVLVLIEKIAPMDFLFSNHVRVAQQVMSEFLSQVKRNGIHDNQGKSIENFVDYIYKIIRGRIKDQLKRERREFNQLPINYELPRVSYKKDVIDDSIIQKEFFSILFKSILPKLDTVERFIFIKYRIEDKNYREITEEINILLGYEFVLSTVQRKLKSAEKKIRLYFSNYYCTTLVV